jgi:type VI secretion system protein ImpK
MKLGQWQLIISLRKDIGRILERTLLPSPQGRGDGNLLSIVDESALSQLRSELRTHLDALKDTLLKELTENETYLVMFPLVLLCDEVVMGRLPKKQHTEWRLLQHELFQINYGGDVFYDFVDERLAKPDTPSMVFEVLFFCLSAGFVGKFGIDGGKVQRYKTLLAERIPGARIPGPRKRRRLETRDQRYQRDPRERREPARHSTTAGLLAATTPEPESSGAAPTPATPDGGPRGLPLSWYYGLALGGVLLAVFGTLLITNL